MRVIVQQLLSHYDNDPAHRTVILRSSIYLVNLYNCERKKMQIFAEDELRDLFHNQLLKLEGEVQGEDKNRILNMNETEYISYLVDRHRIEPLTFYWDSVYASDREEIMNRSDGWGGRYSARTQIITYHIPFSGDSRLLRCAPASSRLMWTQSINVTGNIISFDVVNTRDDLEYIKREADGVIANIKKKLDNLDLDLQKYNDSIEPKVRELVQARKAQLLKQSNLLASLGVPFKKADTVPSTFAVPTIKKTPLIKPSAPSAAFKPEPTLDQQVYNSILRVCYDTGVEMERHPSIYTDKDEESLRDYFIMVLSPHFQSVTGETFNKIGKTDILIRHEKANVFVAECKFWGGIKNFYATIDQILGYLTWRDSKAAIICFIRNKELNPVLQQIEAETPGHPCFVKNHGKVTDGWFTYEFHLKDDPSRGVQLAVLCFHFSS